MGACATRDWFLWGGGDRSATGEIIKGHVTLGSLRVRQDFLIAEGLLGLRKRKVGSAKAQELALARLRQLAAPRSGAHAGPDAPTIRRAR